MHRGLRSHLSSGKKSRKSRVCYHKSHLWYTLDHSGTFCATLQLHLGLSLPRGSIRSVPRGSPRSVPRGPSVPIRSHSFRSDACLPIVRLRPFQVLPSWRAPGVPVGGPWGLRAGPLDALRTGGGSRAGPPGHGPDRVPGGAGPGVGLRVAVTGYGA